MQLSGDDFEGSVIHNLRILHDRGCLILKVVRELPVFLPNRLFSGTVSGGYTNKYQVWRADLITLLVGSNPRTVARFCGVIAYPIYVFVVACVPLYLCHPVPVER